MFRYNWGEKMNNFDERYDERHNEKANNVLGALSYLSVFLHLCYSHSLYGL